MRLCTPHSGKVLMVKKMTTLESRERRGKRNTRRSPVVAVGKEPGALGGLPSFLS
jgi:hypothetical protein